MQEDLERFDPDLPIERASTPPAAWYTDPSIFEHERSVVFRRSWQAVGPAEQVSRPGDFVCDQIVGEPYVALRDGQGDLQAFFNVCRHHAACVAEGRGNAEQLVCPYHGWTYDLDGRLRRAPRLGGVEAFDRADHGLLPLADKGVWGPLLFVRVNEGEGALADCLRPLDGVLHTDGLRFVRRVEYELACNWKVYVDNYLDGGYHVETLHKGLAGQLDLGSYSTEISGRVSLQLCRSGGELDAGSEGVDFRERLGDGAVYAFVYPNFMLNRYGAILDTNLVLPIDHRRTRVIFDYYFDQSSSPEFIERSLVASDQVQQEDVDVCESVQRGLESSAFDRGRYAPGVEQAAYHFHRLLADDLRS